MLLAKLSLAMRMWQQCFLLTSAEGSKFLDANKSHCLALEVVVVAWAVTIGRDVYGDKRIIQT